MGSLNQEPRLSIKFGAYPVFAGLVLEWGNPPSLMAGGCQTSIQDIQFKTVNPILQNGQLAFRYRSN